MILDVAQIRRAIGVGSTSYTDVGFAQTNPGTRAIIIRKATNADMCFRVAYTDATITVFQAGNTPSTVYITNTDRTVFIRVAKDHPLGYACFLYARVT